MANKDVSIIINSTDSGRNKRQKAITNVSETATNNELYAFGRAVNALTVDELNGIVKVSKEELTQQDYTLLGADAVYLQFSGNADDDWAISNYVLVDTNSNPVAGVWTLKAIGDAIPTDIAEVSANSPNPVKSGFISFEGRSPSLGITKVYTYEISVVYNEVTYSKQVKIYLYAKGE